MNFSCWTNSLLNRCVVTTLAFVVACGVASSSSTAQSHDIPRELTGIEITERLGDRIPLDLPFVDEHGRNVTLRDYFTDDLPVIITLNYYNCPLLCTLQLNGLVYAMKELDWSPGRQFRIITISFDPAEGPELAMGKKQAYMSMYDREGVEDSWVFLTGPQRSIDAVTESIGFGFAWNERQQEWAHASALFIAAPDGMLSRYLYGISYESRDLRYALLEASDGKIGTTLDRFLMWCFHYDDTTGQYSPYIMRIMRLFGGLTVVVLGTGLFFLWRIDMLRRPQTASTGETGQGSPA